MKLQETLKKINKYIQLTRYKLLIWENDDIVYYQE